MPAKEWRVALRSTRPTDCLRTTRKDHEDCLLILGSRLFWRNALAARGVADPGTCHSERQVVRSEPVHEPGAQRGHAHDNISCLPDRMLCGGGVRHDLLRAAAPGKADDANDLAAGVVGPGPELDSERPERFLQPGSGFAHHASALDAGAEAAERRAVHIRKSRPLRLPAE